MLGEGLLPSSLHLCLGALTEAAARVTEWRGQTAPVPNLGGNGAGSLCSLFGSSLATGLLCVQCASSSRGHSLLVAIPVSKVVLFPLLKTVGSRVREDLTV